MQLTQSNYWLNEPNYFLAESDIHTHAHIIILRNVGGLIDGCKHAYPQSP